MEVLEIGGESFVKANAIAKELGYTSDYVGQLCRAHKVKAKLVGRSWYVHEQSIRAHKDSRYRSNKTKTKEGLKLEIQSSQKQPTTPVAFGHKPKNFYAKAAEQQFSYLEDSTELIPTLTEKSTRQSVKIDIRHADEKKLPIHESKPGYSMKATAKPKITFSGSITVADVVEKEDTLEVDNKPTKTEKSHAQSATPAKKLQNAQGVVGMQRVAVVTADRETALPIAHKRTNAKRARRGRRGIMLPLSGFIVATSIALILMTLEQEISYLDISAQAAAATEYSIDFSEFSELKQILLSYI